MRGNSLLLLGGLSAAVVAAACTSQPEFLQGGTGAGGMSRSVLIIEAAVG